MSDYHEARSHTEMDVTFHGPITDEERAAARARDDQLREEAKRMVREAKSFCLVTQHARDTEADDEYAFTIEFCSGVDGSKGEIAELYYCLVAYGVERLAELRDDESPMQALAGAFQRFLAEHLLEDMGD